MRGALAYVPTKIPTLFILAVLTIVLHVAIHTTKNTMGGALLDFRLTDQGARSLLASLSDSSGAIEAHLWITVLLDTPYALAYGALVAGLCIRYAGDRSPAWLAAPALAAAGFDLAENAVHLFALTNTADLLVLKPILTPTKFALIAPASAFAIWLWAQAVFGRGSDG